jgi:hypothetical protein
VDLPGHRTNASPNGLFAGYGICAPTAAPVKPDRQQASGQIQRSLFGCAQTNARQTNKTEVAMEDPVFREAYQNVRQQNPDDFGWFSLPVGTRVQLIIEDMRQIVARGVVSDEADPWATAMRRSG